MSQEFYITLPSNVKSSTDFSYNTISSFKTKLHQKLIFPFNEKWKVGLAEISYTKSWYNVRSSHQIKLFSIYGEVHIIDINTKKKRSATDEVSKDFNISDFCIKPGYYDSIQVLVNYINKKFESYKFYLDQIPSLKFDKISHRVTLKPGLITGEVYFPCLGEEVERILGLIDVDDISLYEKATAEKITQVHDGALIPLSNPYIEYLDNIFRNNKLKGSRSAELNAGTHSIFVYSDIVEHNFVGDTFAQLLRLVEVPVNANFGDQIVLRYDQPHYIPLQTKSYDTIQLAFKDDTGENIPFEFGRVIVKLIFKKYG
jgi:hypothetical protein